MRLVTYNVNRGVSADGVDRTDDMIKFLVAADAQIVALQLAPKQFVQRLSTVLGDTWQQVFAPAEDEGKDMIGSALLTRFAITDAVVHNLPPPPAPLPPRVLVQAIVHVPSEDGASSSSLLLIGVVHLENTAEEVRMEQIRAVVEVLEQAGAPTGAPRLLCGDFNALRVADYPPDTWHNFTAFAQEKGWEERQERVVKYLDGLGYTDAFLAAGSGEPYTFHLKFASMHLRIDYVFLAQFAGKLIRCWRDDLDASNHKPLLLDLSM